MSMIAGQENQREQPVYHHRAGDETSGIGDRMLSAGLADKDLSMKRDALMRILFTDENSTR